MIAKKKRETWRLFILSLCIAQNVAKTKQNEEKSTR